MARFSYVTDKIIPLKRITHNVNVEEVVRSIILNYAQSSLNGQTHLFTMNEQIQDFLDTHKALTNIEYDLNNFKQFKHSLPKSQMSFESYLNLPDILKEKYIKTSNQLTIRDVDMTKHIVKQLDLFCLKNKYWFYAYLPNYFYENFISLDSLNDKIERANEPTKEVTYKQTFRPYSAKHEMWQIIKKHNEQHLKVHMMDIEGELSGKGLENMDINILHKWLW
tara:strand:+ start:54 stop:719 length:666 start_codon:yes stop_codon:yes gene_type:complete